MTAGTVRDSNHCVLAFRGSRPFDQGQISSKVPTKLSHASVVYDAVETDSWPSPVTQHLLIAYRHHQAIFSRAVVYSRSGEDAIVNFESDEDDRIRGESVFMRRSST